MHAGVHTLVLLLPSPFALEPSSCPADTDACRSSHSHVAVADYTGAHARVLPIRVCAGVYTLVLPSPFALEPSSCTADTDARRSSHSRAAIADYTGAQLVYSQYRCMQEFNALILPLPITLEPSSCTPTQMYSTRQVSHTTTE